MNDLIEKVKYDKESADSDKKAVHLDEITPGARLRYEREQRNLSIQNIADHLYLESRVIKSLEEDDYDSLPSGIFTRGYIRNYAKYLEIPSEPLLKGYRELTGEVEEISRPIVQPKKSVKPHKQATSKDLWFKFLTFTIIVASFALMALWRLNSSDSPTDSSNETPSELNSGEESIQLPLSFEEEEELPIENIGENGNTPQTLPITESPPVSPAESAQPPAESTENTETTETEVPPPEALDDGTIKLLFDKDAWIAVVDGNDKELKSGTVAKGDELILKGKPPFKIKSARLNAIRVEYKGETQSLKDHPNRDNKWVTIGDAME